MLSPSHEEFAGKWFAEALFGALAEEGNPVFTDLEEARTWIMSRVRADAGSVLSS
jgi:hypothetical protein